MIVRKNCFMGLMLTKDSCPLRVLITNSISDRLDEMVGKGLHLGNWLGKGILFLSGSARVSTHTPFLLKNLGAGFHCWNITTQSSVAHNILRAKRHNVCTRS